MVSGVTGHVALLRDILCSSVINYVHTTPAGCQCVLKTHYIRGVSSAMITSAHFGVFNKYNSSNVIQKSDRNL